MHPLARSLRAAGYRPLNLAYRSIGQPLDRIVDSVADEIDREAHGTIHFIGHSMGGLIARALLARRRPARLGRTVMLGPPNDGSEWVSLLARMRLDRLMLREARHLLTPYREEAVRRKLGEVDYPLGIIAGDRPLDPLFPRLLLPRPNDGKVTVAATHLAGALDHIVLGVPHTLMPLSPRVHRQILAFLRHGRFNR
jgi:pimeloyl-ACP methyl ester carboxylesterase